MTPLTTGPPPLAPPQGSPDAWQEANRAIDHLLRRHRHRLGRATALAGTLKAHLESIFPLLDVLCAVTCPWCPTPCCLMAKVWFDFRDLLFLHLNGLDPPPGQLIRQLDDTCRYIGPRGCRLPRVQRPWGCTRYLCPTQLANLRRGPAAAHLAFEAAVAAIKTGRIELEDELVRIVS